jgi:hypothetical protein
MKVCDMCGDEFNGLDGDNRCEQCELTEHKARARARAKAIRKAREEAYKSCGLVKVKGALGGVYWE